MVQFAIVIIHYNENKYIDKLFDSIKKQTLYPDKIVFVDNNSPINPKDQLLKNKIKNLKFIRTTENVYFAPGTNIGIREALKSNPKIIGILNADMYFDKNCFKTIFDYLEKNPKTVAVNPKVFNYAATSVISHPAEKFDEKNPRKADVIGGANLFVRTDALKLTGLFYEPFYHGTEDIYLSEKLKKIGKLEYVQEAIAYHRDWNEDRPNRNPKNPFYIKLSNRNNLVYIFRTKDSILYIKAVLGFIKNLIKYLITSSESKLDYKSRIEGFIWGHSEALFHLTNNEKYLTKGITVKIAEKWKL